MVSNALSGQESLEQSPKAMREETMQVCWREAFQAQRIARAKAPSWEYASIFKESDAG